MHLNILNRNVNNLPSPDSFSVAVVVTVLQLRRILKEIKFDYYGYAGTLVVHLDHFY